ncbi:MAG: GIY-YIG nuclease family protein [Crocinitomicaceae bacterium]|nr:GIY-YIG nuclease family protein [Crocinitomicaceae bacterium]
MSYFVYILYSDKLDKYYVGYSTNPANRLAFHNSEKNKIWSKRGQPWELKKVFEFEDKTTALKAEQHIKRMKSAMYIESVLKKEIFEMKG